MIKTATQPYVYLLLNGVTGHWYIGSRYASGCHPEDGYMSSSNLVKKCLSIDATNWKKIILYISDAKSVYVLETYLLQKLDAKNNKKSLNQHNNDGLGSVYKGPWNKGKKLSSEQTGWTEERRQLARQQRLGKSSGIKGKKWSEQARVNHANAPKRVGYQHSEQTKSKIGQKSIGRPQQAWKDPILKAELIKRMLETRMQNKILNRLHGEV